MTKQNKAGNFFDGPVWSTLLLDGRGGATLSKVGLTADEARTSVDASCMTNPRYTDRIFALAPPPYANRHTDGTFGVAYIIGGAAYLHAAGITKADAEQIAKQVIALCGPDAPPKDDADSMNLTPVVREAYAIDVTPVMWELGLAVPIF